MFNADELRRFLRFLPRGEVIVELLPGVNAAPATFANEAVAALSRDGVLNQPLFWSRLRSERPGRVADIDRVKAVFDAEQARPSPVPAAPEPAPSEVAPWVADAPFTTSKLIVLLVSASPDSNERIRVDKEFTKIIEQVRASRFRDRIEFVQVQASTLGILRSRLMEHQPHVLHLSTHGTADGSLIFEADGDSSRVVAKKNFIRLLKSLKDRLRLVFLNACHSREIARDIPPTIDLAIGMRDAVNDTAAIRLSVAFYEALAFGRTVDNAFDVALSDLDGDDDAIPQLFPAAEQDPDKKRQYRFFPAPTNT